MKYEKKKKTIFETETKRRMVAGSGDFLDVPQLDRVDRVIFEIKWGLQF